MSDVTLFHNPACSKSRQALALIREAGIEPVVVEYLRTPPDRAALARLVDALGVPVRSLVRTGGEAYATLGLADPALTDGQLLDALAAHPALLERPIVVTARGARVGRPPERVLEVLPPTPGSQPEPGMPVRPEPAAPSAA